MDSKLCMLCIALMTAAGTAQSQVLVSDGFGDGDRDNDGVLEGPVTDAGDIGQAWYFARGSSAVTASIAADTGIGSGNALDLVSDTASSRFLISNFAATTLADGDRITLAMDVRITENPINPVDSGGAGDGDRRLRMGLYNSRGTHVTEDSSDLTLTDDDTGYNIQIDTGTADGGTTITGRGDPAPSLLGGSSVSMGASGTDSASAATNTAKRYEYVIRRVGNDLSFALVVDGVVAQEGSILEADLTANDLDYTFDTVAFGTSGAAIDYRVDNIEVLYIAAPETSASEDGFEDGDRDNDGVADGPVNDALDLGFPWFFARGTSGMLVDVADDSGGIGSGNAFRALVSTTSTRAMIASIDEVTLADGQMIAFQFDVRLDGFAPDSDRRFRYGIYNSEGTPVTEDTGSSTTTDDDTGYMVQMDTGVSPDSSITIRRDLVGSLTGGGTFALGATSDDPQWSLGTTKRTVRLELERRGDEMDARAFVDGMLATSGFDPTPETYTFDEIVFSTNSIPLVSFLVDNVVVETPSADVCLPDVNHDGMVTPADFSAWIAAYNANAPECDQNSDGMCTPADFTAWIVNYNAGCM